MSSKSKLKKWLPWFSRAGRKQLRRQRVRQEFDRYLASLPRNAVAIDCGANVGDFTESMLRQGLRVIAFEPDPLAAEALRRRFAGRAGVTIHEKAVGIEDARAKIYQRSGAAGDINLTKGSSLLQKKANRIAVAEIDVVNLPAFIERLGEPVALLKIDIEGAEVEVLEALLDTGLYRRVGRIFVETHERFSPELAARTAVIRRRCGREGARNINLNWS